MATNGSQLSSLHSNEITEKPTSAGGSAGSAAFLDRKSAADVVSTAVHNSAGQQPDKQIECIQSILRTIHGQPFSISRKPIPCKVSAESLSTPLSTGDTSDPTVDTSKYSDPNDTVDTYLDMHLDFMTIPLLAKNSKNLLELPQVQAFMQRSTLEYFFAKQGKIRTRRVCILTPGNLLPRAFYLEFYHPNQRSAAEFYANFVKNYNGKEGALLIEDLLKENNAKGAEKAETVRKAMLKQFDSLYQQRVYEIEVPAQFVKPTFTKLDGYSAALCEQIVSLLKFNCSDYRSAFSRTYKTLNTRLRAADQSSLADSFNTLCRYRILHQRLMRQEQALEEANLSKDLSNVVATPFFAFKKRVVETIAKEAVDKKVDTKRASEDKKTTSEDQKSQADTLPSKTDLPAGIEETELINLDYLFIFQCISAIHNKNSLHNFPIWLQAALQAEANKLKEYLDKTLAQFKTQSQDKHHAELATLMKDTDLLLSRLKLLSENENAVHLPIEFICKFLSNREDLESLQKLLKDENPLKTRVKDIRAKFSKTLQTFLTGNTQQREVCSNIFQLIKYCLVQRARQTHYGLFGIQLDSISGSTLNSLKTRRLYDRDARKKFFSMGDNALQIYYPMLPVEWMMEILSRKDKPADLSDWLRSKTKEQGSKIEEYSQNLENQIASFSLKESWYSKIGNFFWSHSLYGKLWNSLPIVVEPKVTAPILKKAVQTYVDTHRVLGGLKLSEWVTETSVTNCTKVAGGVIAFYFMGSYQLIPATWGLAQAIVGYEGLGSAVWGFAGASFELTRTTGLAALSYATHSVLEPTIDDRTGTVTHRFSYAPSLIDCYRSSTLTFALAESIWSGKPDAIVSTTLGMTGGIAMHETVLAVKPQLRPNPNDTLELIVQKGFVSDALHISGQVCATVGTSMVLNWASTRDQWRDESVNNLSINPDILKALNIDPTAPVQIETPSIRLNPNLLFSGNNPMRISGRNLTEPLAGTRDVIVETICQVGPKGGLYHCAKPQAVPPQINYVTSTQIRRVHL